MKDKLLSKIIDNFKEQFNLYNQMLDLSVRQSGLLQENFEDINALHALLTARKKLMEDIINLNQDNKALQKQLISELGINEFVIKKLKGLVDDELLQDLDKIVTDISSLLSNINERDRLNEALIREAYRKKPQTFKTTSAAKATLAYKKAMQKEDK